MTYNSFSSALFQLEGTMPTSSRGLAHLENYDVLADDSFSLMWFYVTMSEKSAYCTTGKTVTNILGFQDDFTFYHEGKY